MRAMVLNGTKMACYDQIKGMITKSGFVPSGGYSGASYTSFPASPPPPAG
jgi:hypothetical protein